MEIPDVLEILNNIQQTLKPFWGLITTLTFFLGILFAIRAMFLFKRYGELLGGMVSSRMSIRQPIINLVVAAVLLYWPGVLERMLTTLYADPDILKYEDAVTTTGSELFDKTLEVTGGIVQLIGYIAFLRGWVLLVRVGEQSAQQGALARALLHIVGGLLAINIYGTFSVLNATIGGVF